MTQSPLEPNLLHRIQELQQRCDQKQQIVHTDFLDAQTVSQIQQYLSFHTFPAFHFSGGYPDAERQVLFFLPDWQDPADFQPETFFTFLRLRPTAPQGLTHRDYLGSCMALGVKREKMGDILVLEDGAEFIVLPSIVPYLLSNVTRIGRTSTEIVEISPAELQLPVRQTIQFTRTTASLRCDTLVSAAFSLSRSEAVAAISKGLVAVNHLPEEKADRTLSLPCMLSVRGKGRVYLETEQNRSRKGRIFIHITQEK